MEFGPVKTWLGQVEAVMRRIFARSNVYQALPFLYNEWGLFGTMAGLVFEDPETVIRIEPMTAGTYWLAENRYGRIDTLMRERRMTARQIWQEFDHDKIPVEVKNCLSNGRLEQEFVVSHVITPRDELGDSGMAFKSCYWMQGRGEGLLAERGFVSDPLLTARWDWVSGDVYGADSPGISGLSAAKQLQREQINLASVNEKNTDPPMQAPASLMTTGLSLMRGEVNYVADTSTAGIRSVYDFRHDATGTVNAIGQLQAELKQLFYYDLFLMLSYDERKQRATAEEIRALYDEKVSGLGPVLEQANPMLSKLIDRTFDICVGRSQAIWNGVQDGEPLFPMPPEELRDQQLDVDFISPLQQAQRSGALQSIERFATFVGQLAAAAQDPSVLDKVDLDQVVDIYGDALSVDAEAVRDDDQVAAIRGDRVKQQQMQQTAAMAPALAQGAKAVRDLGETKADPESVLASLSGALAGGGGAAP